LARLKAYDPRHGQTLKRFTYQGVRFRADRGWCRVTLAVADYLRKVRARPDDPRSPLAFDVCTDEEAKALEAQEQKEQAIRHTITDASEVEESKASSGRRAKKKSKRS